MSNILDYLDWRGDLSFEVSPFCPIDNLIFSKLIYADLEGVVPRDFSSFITLSAAFDRYTALGRGNSGRAGDPCPLFEKAAHSARFANVLLSGYEKLFDEARNVQFAAVAFSYKNGVFLAFEGTDDSLVGWREDAGLSFLEVTEGQKAAADYARRARIPEGARLYLGGHSKGGNLAVYAAANGLDRLPDGVFNNDGPGMNAALAASPAYRAIAPRVVKYLPESSIVGILLFDGCETHVVKSDGKGIGQHNVYTWQVRGRDFAFADKRSASSVFADETVRKWMASMDNERRGEALNALFDALESAGCKTFRELNAHKRASYNAILKAVVKTDPQSRKVLLTALKNAAKSSGEVIWDSAKRSFEQSGAVKKIKGKLKKPAALPEKIEESKE